MAESWTIERAAREKPPVFHPLAGANFRTFWKNYLANGPYDGRSRAPRAVAAACSFVRQPFYTAKKVLYNGSIAAHKPSAPPVFIVGHWRSGTTHLHNLMSRDPAFGWINLHQTGNPWSMVGTGVDLTRRLMSLILPETRGMDNVSLSLDSPQEEEMALGNMNPLGFYNCYYFPRSMREHFAQAVLLEDLPPGALDKFTEAYRELHLRLSHANGGRRILFKNPPSTARLSLLAKTFPGAKFVHIVRNPCDVFTSTLAHFPRVLSAFAWQKFDDLDFEKATLDHYSLLMRHYLREREKIPAEDLIETRFEKIVADPLGEIARIYDSLEIPGADVALGEIATYIETLAGFEKNEPGPPTGRQAERIREQWAFAFDEWDYEPPAGTSGAE